MQAAAQAAPSGLPIDLIERAPVIEAYSGFKVDLDEYGSTHIHCWPDDAAGDAFFSLRRYGADCWTKLTAAQCRELAEGLQAAADELEARNA